MSRETCWRCFWPKEHCFCGMIQPMPSRSHFVLLMHPMEFKREKANTGRLTRLCLANSQILMGLDFSNDQQLDKILHDSSRQLRLLWPGDGAMKLGVTGENTDEVPGSPNPVLQELEVDERPLTLIILDATWACAKQMFRDNPPLQKLPRIELQTRQPSRYTIKRQPKPGFLSTLETCHELLLALEAAGLDTYPDKTQLYAVFDRMQAFQQACAAHPPRPSYRQP